MNRIVIGVSGKLGVGKDFISNIIEQHLSINHKVIRLAFADLLKILTMIEYDISFDRVYVKKDEESRQLLQNIGAEYRKKSLDFWIKGIDSQINIFQHKGFDAFIITDVRYQNEADYIKSIGKLIRIVAPIRNQIKLEEESNNNPDIKNHLSETDLDNYEFDYIIKNDPDDVIDIKKIVEKIL